MVAAIVTTMLFVPAAVLLAGTLFLFDASVAAVATFGGAIGGFQALAVWWMASFLPVLGYAIWLLPWIPPEP